LALAAVAASIAAPARKAAAVRFLMCIVFLLERFG
jgi:hypothetical protein